MLARNALGKRETRALRVRNMDDQTFVEVMEVLLDLTRNAATSLRSIDASWNGITNHGASKLLEAMHHNTGIVEVKDSRLKQLETIHDSKKVVASTLEFVDIAGIVKGASQGEGLGNKFLSNIRECDAIVHVVRCFEDDNIIHGEDGRHNCRDYIREALGPAGGRAGGRSCKHTQTGTPKVFLCSLETCLFRTPPPCPPVES